MLHDIYMGFCLHVLQSKSVPEACKGRGRHSLNRNFAPNGLYLGERSDIHRAAWTDGQGGQEELLKDPCWPSPLQFAR